MSTDHQDLRERIATTLASHDLPDNTDRDGQWAADALMPLITAELDERWEQGRKHGLRQARAPQRGREKQLEEEIESMLTIEEGNSRAFHLKCERVRELEARLADRDIERRRTVRDLELLVASTAHILVGWARAQALADRRWVAWQSARERATAYGEGILRHVEERDWALGWLKTAEGHAAELDIENKKLRAVIEAVSCAGSLDEVGEALEQTITAPTHTHHTE